MAEKVDQDVREAAAVTMVLAEMRDLVIGGKMDDHPSVKAFARMKAAGRQQGLREAAEVARDGCRCRTCGAYFLGSEGHECERPDWDGLVYSSDYAAAITALIEGEGK